jgi:hypothetical protein
MLDMSVIMLVSQSSIGPYSVQNEVIIANPKTNSLLEPCFVGRKTAVVDNGIK